MSAARPPEGAHAAGARQSEGGRAGGFIAECWYAAASSDEVGSTPLARRLLDQKVVLFRTSTGAPAALRDRCVHRFAPLSMGTVCGDAVACPYHGMQFGADGQCVKIPGQERIPVAAAVQSFPTLERYGLVFVWMGDLALAAASQLVDIPAYDAPGIGLSRGYSMFEACWQNIADNLIDPAHTTFVHQRTIGNDAGEDVVVKARDIGDGVIECGRWVDDAPAVPVVERFAKPQGNVDRWQFYYLKAPTTSWVDFGAMPTGLPHTSEEKSKAPYRVISYAFLTPQTATTTHYFSFQLRNFAADDAEVTAEFNQLYKLTFDEDRELLEAIQREENEHPELKPLRIATDVGVTRLRALVAGMQITA
ncbi:aromatic ring-hydroxylating dioxygenase subunit alpha [soil metagenome]